MGDSKQEKKMFLFVPAVYSMPILGSNTRSCSVWSSLESTRSLTTCQARLRENYPCPAYPEDSGLNKTDAFFAHLEAGAATGTKGWFYDICCNKNGSSELHTVVTNSGFCTPSQCYFNPGADFCVRSPALSCYDDSSNQPYYVSNQCCYDSDESLITLRTSGAGSMGLQPGTFSNIMAHYDFDLQPFAECCLLEDGSVNTDPNNEAVCNSFLTARPTIIGTYSGSAVAESTMLSHIRTLDGKDYTFFGLGVYTYLITSQATPFKMQVSTRVKGNGTVISGFAISYGGVAVFDLFRLSETSTKIAIRRQSVTLDRIYLVREGVVITQPVDDIIVVAILDANVIISVLIIDDFFSITVSVPTSFLGIAQGLLGYFDGAVANDFTTPG